MFVDILSKNYAYWTVVHHGKILDRQNVSEPIKTRNFSGSDACHVINTANLATYSFKRSDETTTDTDEAAIAADAIHGCNVTPSV